MWLCCYLSNIDYSLIYLPYDRTHFNWQFDANKHTPKNSSIVILVLLLKDVAICAIAIKRHLKRHSRFIFGFVVWIFLFHATHLDITATSTKAAAVTKKYQPFDDIVSIFIFTATSWINEKTVLGICNPICIIQSNTVSPNTLLVICTLAESHRNFGPTLRSKGAIRMNEKRISLEIFNNNVYCRLSGSQFSHS